MARFEAAVLYLVTSSRARTESECPAKSTHCVYTNTYINLRPENLKATIRHINLMPTDGNDFWQIKGQNEAQTLWRLIDIHHEEL